MVILTPQRVRSLASTFLSTPFLPSSLMRYFRSITSISPFGLTLNGEDSPSIRHTKVGGALSTIEDWQCRGNVVEREGKRKKEKGRLIAVWQFNSTAISDQQISTNINRNQRSADINKYQLSNNSATQLASFLNRRSLESPDASGIQTPRVRPSHARVQARVIK
jgi:hypothetical protein